MSHHQPSQDESREEQRRASVSQLRIAPEERARAPWRPRGLLLAAAVALAAVAFGVWLSRDGKREAAPMAGARPSPTSSPTPAATPPPAQLSAASSPGTPPAKHTTSSPPILAGGRVEAGHRAELSPGRGGVVAALRVPPGARVPAGTVLAELDNEVEKAGVDVRRAALDALSARLAELKEGSRAEEGEAARSEVAAADSVWRDARLRAERDQKLLEKGAASTVQALESQSAEETARARLAQSRARLALLEKGSRHTVLAAAHAEVARARAELAQAEAALRATRLLAPTDGSILEVRLNPGETFAPGMGPALLAFGDLEHLVVKVDLPEAQVAQVRVGDAAQATVEALAPASFKARVESIALEADRQKGTVEITAALLESDPRIRPRMSARLSISTREDSER
jgi:HlyD family secretion protein